jgi:CspA family cold shock protein
LHSERDAVNDKTTGRLISWNTARGFGWATVDTGGPDAFIHIGECASGAPAIGQRLRFALTLTAKGPRAADVEVLTEARHAR